VVTAAIPSLPPEPELPFVASLPGAPLALESLLEFEAALVRSFEAAPPLALDTLSQGPSSATGS
jgi:hypothetical protein